MYQVSAFFKRKTPPFGELRNVTICPTDSRSSKSPSGDLEVISPNGDFGEIVNSK